MKFILLVTGALLIWGCSTATTVPSGKGILAVRESDRISVRQCRYLGKIPGPTGYTYWGSPPVMGGFKAQAAAQAKQMGATDITWGEEKVSGDPSPYDGKSRVFGYAYDCTGVAMPQPGPNEGP